MLRRVERLPSAERLAVPDQRSWCGGIPAIYGTVSLQWLEDRFAAPALGEPLTRIRQYGFGFDTPAGKAITGRVRCSRLWCGQI